MSVTVQNSILTIGHSVHNQNDFVATLRNNGVTAIADVRSSPSSRAAPQFNRPSFSRFLKRNAIEYVFLGSELGARSDDPRNYDDGKVMYARLARTPEFSVGIDRLIAGMRVDRIAIMCAEANPLECHRAILIAPRLSERGIQVEHVLPGGALEPHADLMLRLRAMHGLLEPDLFSSADELERAALARQEARIAYVDPGLAAGESS